MMNKGLRWIPSVVILGILAVLVVQGGADHAPPDEVVDALEAQKQANMDRLLELQAQYGHPVLPVKEGDTHD